jgi:hypothetical protein
MTEEHGDLRDAILEDEIEMVGELVVAATDSDGPLSQDAIDAALGVAPETPSEDALASATRAPIRDDLGG